MGAGAVAAICGAFGLVVGSFANVVIWRVPRHESLVRPGSHCPSCDHPLAWHENVPLVSWLVQRGRCRHCDAPIGARYPAVELATALLFAAVGARFASTPWVLPAYLVLAGALVAITVIDLEHLLIPNRIVYPVGIASVVGLAVAALATGEWGALGRAVLGALVYLAAFYLLWLAVGGRALGFGDVRLAFVLGLFLGWLGWAELGLGMFLPFLVGSLLGILAVVPWLALPMAVGAGIGWVVGVDLAEQVLVEPPDDPTRSRAGAAIAVAVFVGSLLYLVGSLTRRIPRGRQIPFGPSMAVGALLVILLS